MNTYAANRYEGRIYALDGRLHMVVEARAGQELARISTRIDAEHVVLEVPLKEVRQHLAVGNELELTDMGRSGQSRIQEHDEGWFYVTREGLKGPYESQALAQQALDTHILGKAANG